MNHISITKVKNSRLSSTDFSDLPFGKKFADHMFIADYKNGKWENQRIVPFEALPMHPASMVLHYGQAIFEGMKASKKEDGTPALFRPEMHSQRINASAARLCMPAFPEEDFLNAVHTIVDLEKEWIPKEEGSALYLRPFMYATDEFIGVRPSSTYRFVIFTCPVGPYYPKPVRLLTETTYVRAAQGGTGEAKAAGNYAGSLLPARLANEKGYDQVLWLDAKEFKYVQEAGTMNLFFVIGDTVVTPSTTGTILKGITRNSFLQILKNKGIKVEERMITIDEIVEAHMDGSLKECFGSGTAAVVAHVAAIQHEDTLMELPPIENREIGAMLKNEINGYRSGRITDPFGWVVPVKKNEMVTV